MKIYPIATINPEEMPEIHNGSSMNTFCRHRAAVLSLLAGPVLWAIAATYPCAAQAHLPLAVPADTLTKPVGAAKPPSAEGFIQRWMILEPIPASQLTQNAVQAEVKKEYFPEQFTAIPHDGDKVKAGGLDLTWHAEDTKNYNVDLYQYARSLGKETSNVVFWAVTIVDCPQEMHDVRLAIGSNAASVWWVNGKEVIGIYGDRQTVIDDGVSKRLTLNKGPNIIRAAVVNGGGATDFCARFLGAGDKPLKNLTIRLSETRM
jgi:hypothetical protein